MSSIWDRWGALTRSMISTRIAIHRERLFWEQLDFSNRSQLKLKATVRESKHPIRLVDHVHALEDEGTLLAATFVLSYALAESATLEHLSLDSRHVGGIEDWGGRLLQRAGATWTDVSGGLEGAVELGVVRNLLVHGQTEIDKKNCARLTNAGCEVFRLGDSIDLSYARVSGYRSRLRSLLVVGGLGIIP